ncbi:MAG: hypothetical protein GXP45_02640 [bacterium]|nr:hypothetical protein [bacterium]
MSLSAGRMISSDPLAEGRVVVAIIDFQFLASSSDFSGTHAPTTLIVF